MDPVVCVQVGDEKNRKYTSVKESTNCPYYDEVCLLLLSLFSFFCSVTIYIFMSFMTQNAPGK